MPCINNWNRCPYILQREEDWCISASIENVLGYHGFDLCQEQIDALYISETNPGGMSLPSMATILDRHYGDRFHFEGRSWSDQNLLVNHVEICITNNLPVIVSMNLSGSNGAHMFTVLCIDENDVRIFDTGFRERSRLIRRDFFVSHLAHGLNALTISPV